MHPLITAYNDRKMAIYAFMILEPEKRRESDWSKITTIEDFIVEFQLESLHQFPFVVP